MSDMMERKRDFLESNGYIRLQEILTMIPVTRQTWCKGVREGKYPEGVVIPGLKRVWRRADVEAFVSSLKPGEA